MLARVLGFAILALTLCAFGLQAGGGAKDGKDKKVDSKDKKVDSPKDKKFEVPKDAIAGTVKAVDMKTPSFTITLKTTGKDRTFGVTDKTEFWGPKGGDRGTGPKGLKDDCMDKGYEIKVVATADGKSAKDVFFPNRKPAEAKKTDTKKS